MQSLILRMAVFLVTAVFLFGPQAGHAQEAGDALRFDPFPRGEQAETVRKLWSTIPRYQEHFDLLGTWPDHMLATAEMNDDGHAEIFVRMSSPIEGYCDKKGITCLLHIYGVRDGMYVELGRMMAGAQVIPMPSTQNGYRDLMIKNAEDEFNTYRYDGNIYQQVKGQ